jgi:hypothetical protein
MRLASTMALAVLFAGCGPETGDVFENLSTGERIEIQEVAECGYLVKLSEAMFEGAKEHDPLGALEWPGPPDPLPAGADSSSTCYRYIEHGEFMTHQRVVLTSDVPKQWKKLN